MWLNCQGMSWSMVHTGFWQQVKVTVTVTHKLSEVTENELYFRPNHQCMYVFSLAHIHGFARTGRLGSVGVEKGLDTARLVCGEPGGDSCSPESSCAMASSGLEEVMFIFRSLKDAKCNVQGHQSIHALLS